MIVGAAMMQVRTIAELATASNKNEPANSPAASNANATASTDNEARAMLATRILLFRLLKATSAGIVR